MVLFSWLPAFDGLLVSALLLLMLADPLTTSLSAGDLDVLFSDVSEDFLFAKTYNCWEQNQRHVIIQLFLMSNLSITNVMLLSGE